MEFVLLGWPEDGPRLDLDHRTFPYAGKFGTPRTGKAIARSSTGNRTEGASGTEDGPVAAAAAFNDDRGTEAALRIRYLSVRENRQGEGIGPRLAAFVAARARSRGYERVRIAVNNPAAYQALYRAGFGYTGEEAGMAELVLEYPSPANRDPDRYRAGLRAFGDRDLPDGQREVVERNVDGSPPEPVAPPRDE